MPRHVVPAMLECRCADRLPLDTQGDESTLCNRQPIIVLVNDTFGIYPSNSLGRRAVNSMDMERPTLSSSTTSPLDAALDKLVAALGPQLQGGVSIPMKSRSSSLRSRSTS